MTEEKKQKLTVIAVNLIGDALRDFIDPRTRDI